ncbi:MAG: hypothetical protein MN733_31365, partial [Nitrososphaera sp.]|nr:hypothetical protein [Nitrososphaera sp.]
MESFSISDEDGVPVESAAIGNELYINSNLTNIMETQESIAHIIQIRDPEDRVVFLSLTTYSIQGMERKILQNVWQPRAEGKHLLQVFVWRDSEPPIPLSLSSAKVD